MLTTWYFKINNCLSFNIFFQRDTAHFLQSVFYVVNIQFVLGAEKVFLFLPLIQYSQLHLLHVRIIISTRPHQPTAWKAYLIRKLLADFITVLGLHDTAYIYSVVTEKKEGITAKCIKKHNYCHRKTLIIYRGPPFLLHTHFRLDSCPFKCSLF